MKHTHRVQVNPLAAEMHLSGPEVRHLRVMRVKVGDVVEVFDGAGTAGEATLLEIDDVRATLQLLNDPAALPPGDMREYPQPVTLAIALLKGDKLSDVVRASTELGVARIQLLTTRYADVPDIGDNKLSRLRRVAAEAAKQSQRLVIPEVLSPVALNKYAPEGQVFFAHPGSKETVLAQVRWNTPLTFITGPEGGLSDEEVSALAQFATPLTLGPRILRAETAPLALLGALAASGV